jgi:hypothetical protein
LPKVFYDGALSIFGSRFNETLSGTNSSLGYALKIVRSLKFWGLSNIVRDYVGE